MLMPGVFGCSNMSVIGKQVPLVGGQDKVVVDKLDDLFDWAKTAPRVGGFNPWVSRYLVLSMYAPIFRPAAQP